MKNFRNLKVWEKAHLLTLDSYGVTNSFPRQELFGITSPRFAGQLRRSALTSRKAAGSAGMESSSGISILLLAQQANWSTTFF